METDKFKALVHFIVYECRKYPEKLSAIRLNKTLWYADVLAYKANGASITGENYIKQEMGPVPAHILSTIRNLVNEGKIVVQEPEYHFDTRKYVSIASPVSDDLSDYEKFTTKCVLGSVCGFSASTLSEMTHDIIWGAAAIGEEIPLFATLASNEGVITEEVMAWADEFIAQKQAV